MAETSLPSLSSTGDIGVYRIVFPATGDVYIGSSNNVPLRVYRHMRSLMLGTHKNRALQRAWVKTSGSGVTFEVVETCSRDDLRAHEARWIDGTKPNLNVYAGSASRKPARPRNYRDFKINGILFSTMQEAAAHFGVPQPAVRYWLDTRGLDCQRPSRHPSRQVFVRGKSYPSMALAAEDTGLSKAALRRLVSGLGEPKKVEPAPKPVLAEGREYPSMRSAARGVGIHISTLCDRLRSGRYQYI